MGSVTASTIWPALSISDEVKKLVDHFFTLVDLKSDDSGERIAKEVFTKDGIFILADGTFKGTAGKTTHHAYPPVKHVHQLTNCALTKK